MKVRMFGGGFEEFWGPLAIRSNGSQSSPQPPARTLSILTPIPSLVMSITKKKDAALQRAQELFETTDNFCWEVVTVRKQVVDWFYEEDRIAGWDEEIDIM
jgi:hypothetical protein